MRNKVEHFWSRVEKTSSCWLWTGYKGRYGYLTFNGERMSAHRLAYTLTKGAIPDGKVVMHTCDNTLCVNPNHLELGSQQDNIADMIKKGRNVKPKGIEHHATKLTPEIINYIKNSEESTYSLMKKFSLSRPTVCRVRKGGYSCADNVLSAFI